MAKVCHGDIQKGSEALVIELMEESTPASETFKGMGITPKRKLFWYYAT